MHYCKVTDEMDEIQFVSVSEHNLRSFMMPLLYMNRAEGT